MNNEKKADMLAAAIHAKDLARVIECIEVLGCRPDGPAPWNEVPLGLAALSGSTDIAAYLITRNARPDDATLRAEIKSNSLAMVEFISDTCKAQWSVHHYESAFKKSIDIRRYAMQEAEREGWLERNDTYDHDAWCITAALRQTLFDLGEYEIKSFLDFLVKSGAAQALWQVPDGDSPLAWLIGFIENKDVNGFSAAWGVIHAEYFQGGTHAALDSYASGRHIQQLCYSAIVHGSDEIFYQLLAVTLPNLERCLRLARETNNKSLLAYLSASVAPEPVR